MGTEHIELFDMLVLSPPFTLESLFPFELLCYPSITNDEFANTADVKAIEEARCCKRDARQCSESTLLV